MQILLAVQSANVKEFQFKNLSTGKKLSANTLMEKVKATVINNWETEHRDVPN